MLLAKIIEGFSISGFGVAVLSALLLSILHGLLSLAFKAGGTVVPKA